VNARIGTARALAGHFPRCAAAPSKRRRQPEDTVLDRTVQARLSQVPAPEVDRLRSKDAV
jgi:hypothetical protein